KQLLLFGVVTPSTSSVSDATTWVLKGSGWAAATQQGPGQSRAGAMVYDSASRRVVFATGVRLGNGSSRTETWTWDGGQWKLADAGLLYREYPALAADPSCRC